MQQSKVTIYSQENIDSLPWPDSEAGRRAQKIIKPFITLGTKNFITNIDTKMKALLIDDKVLPITICSDGTENSYVCSPYCHYVTYGREELRNLKNKPLKYVLEKAVSLWGKILNFCSIDKNVIVNNWLLPTNLHPELTKDQLQAVTNKLLSLYPDHTIMFRSINSKQPHGLYKNLKELGYSFVVSRKIYFTDPEEDKPFKSRMFKSDQKILNNSLYTTTTDIEKLGMAIPRIKELYYALNIKKYSKCNPQYSEDFIKLALETQWMTFKAFENNKKIDAVFGYFLNEDVMTSPFFGYDLSLPSSIGLYRQISTQLLLDAKDRKMLLHQSSGAGNYKKLRRAKEFVEYSAVYHEHLPPKRRLGWMALEVLMNSLGKRFM